MSALYNNKNKITSGHDLGNALMKLIEDNLDLDRWKFRLSYKNFLKSSSSIAIYDSELCRLSFMFSRGRLPEYDELSIEYGRLHASNENPFIELNGADCRCWHHTAGLLRFLDGLSPSEAVHQSKTQKRLPAIIQNFGNSETGKKLLNEYPPKYAIVLQSKIWEHYGQDFFDLFDLRQTELWERYRRFLKDYYELTGIKADRGPAYENVC
jgi:hypothetical protein